MRRPWILALLVLVAFGPLSACVSDETSDERRARELKERFEEGARGRDDAPPRRAFTGATCD